MEGVKGGNGGGDAAEAHLPAPGVVGSKAAAWRVPPTSPIRLKANGPSPRRRTVRLPHLPWGGGGGGGGGFPPCQRSRQSDPVIRVHAHETRTGNLESGKRVSNEQIAKCATPRETHDDIFPTASGLLASPRKLWKVAAISPVEPSSIGPLTPIAIAAGQQKASDAPN